MADALKCCLPNLPFAPPHICRNSHLKFNVNPTFPFQLPPIRKLPMASTFAERAHGFRGQRMASRVRVGGLVAVRCTADDGGEENGHGFYMWRCVELARKAVGCTNSNPMVGCVIVKYGKVVGEGLHPKAEVFTLRDAGDLAENATAYVSLKHCMDEHSSSFDSSNTLCYVRLNDLLLKS